MKLTDLRVNHVKNPLGFQTIPLSFSWKVTEAGEAKRMESARLQIFNGDTPVFDSGEKRGMNSLDYNVDISLMPRTHYTWTVEVTADNRQKAEATGHFETGKMEEKWTAK